MALLQIAEPGLSTSPHEHRLAVGIDLGTTHSLVAAVRHSSTDVLPDEQGRFLLPSIVHYQANGKVSVGYEALAAQMTDPSNTIASVKRLMGRGITDLNQTEQTQLAYELIDAPGMVKISTVQGHKTPVEVSAQILRTLRIRAEQTLGDRLLGAVITVPAYFDEAQRQATKDAAELAGIEVLRLLNEPTAAAIAYGLEHSSEGTYVVYDLGGGTFDISILRLSKGLFEVIATGGDAMLGGDDFDNLIVDWLIEQANISLTLNALDKTTLRLQARHAKEQLSSLTEVPLKLTLSSGQEIAQVLTLQKFNQLSLELLSKTLSITQDVLRDAQITVKQVQGVVLVGGATRMLCVREAIASLFDCQPCLDLDPDQVVALGAAKQANSLVGNETVDDDWLLLDVVPLSLGIETMGGLVEKIIPRNATIPVARSQEFTTFKDGQTAISLQILQGERELVNDCRSIGHFELQGIPPMPAGMARLKVTFQVDADGLLEVTAQEQHSGVQAAIHVKPSYGLSDEEIARMLSESIDHARSDMQLRMIREQTVKAQQFIHATKQALAEDGDLLTSEEQSAIELTVQALQGLITPVMALPSALTQELKLAPNCDSSSAPNNVPNEGPTENDLAQHTDLIREAIDKLAKSTESFAARRMDRTIRKALTGQKIANL